MRDVRDIKAAVVGTGFIGVVHVEALRRLGIEVTGVVGSTPERAAEKAARRRLPPPYPSFEAMLADPAVDVVHLTTPNHLHYAQVTAGARRRQARRLREAAGDELDARRPSCSSSPSEPGSSTRSTSTTASTRMSSRRARACAPARSATCGSSPAATCRTGCSATPTGTGGSIPPRAASLRAVGDIGSHWLDLVQFVTGRRVEAVMADLTTFIPIRKQPTGPVETFSGGRVRARRSTRRWRPRTPPASCSGFERRRPRGGDRLAGVAPAARTGCTGRSTAPPTRWPGTPRTPSGCGSATATGRTS